MPLTFPAHQAAVLPLKLWRPQWFDATALCGGAAAPDLAYPLGWWLNRQSHTAVGVAVWAIPFTLLVCGILRRRAAAGVFAHLPDAGPLRLRSYRVLDRRRPLLLITLVSAFIGATSHVLVDGFTHERRWGARWLGLEAVIGELPVRGELSVARALQYAGHVGGSLVAVALFVHVGRRRLLERWYGTDTVSARRAVVVSPAFRVAFWAVALAPPLAVGAWASAGRDYGMFATMLAGVVGLLAAGTLPLYREGTMPGRPTPLTRRARDLPRRSW